MSEMYEQNQVRANRGFRAIDFGSPDLHCRPIQACMEDVLVNIMHWARRHKIDCEQVIAAARVRFLDQVKEEIDAQG